MLNAILFFINGVGSALAALLNVEIPFTDQINIKFYDIFVFMFLLPMFIKFIYIIMNKSVDVSNRGSK